jgi:hypothetical protein
MSDSLLVCCSVQKLCILYGSILVTNISRPCWRFSARPTVNRYEIQTFCGRRPLHECTICHQQAVTRWPQLSDPKQPRGQSKYNTKRVLLSLTFPIDCVPDKRRWISAGHFTGIMLPSIYLQQLLRVLIQARCSKTKWEQTFSQFHPLSTHTIQFSKIISAKQRVNMTNYTWCFWSAWHHYIGVCSIGKTENRMYVTIGPWTLNKVYVLDYLCTPSPP